MIDYREGENSTRQPWPEKVCAGCRRTGGVVYTGSDVLEGRIEWLHVMHTQLRNHYRCTHCGAEWSEERMV